MFHHYITGNELVQFNQPPLDLSLFDMESAISAGNSDINTDLDELFGDVTDAPLSTPEITDKQPQFGQTSKNEKTVGKGCKKLKTYSSKKSKWRMDPPQLLLRIELVHYLIPEWTLPRNSDAGHLVVKVYRYLLLLSSFFFL